MRAHLPLKVCSTLQLACGTPALDKGSLGIGTSASQAVYSDMLLEDAWNVGCCTPRERSGVRICWILIVPHGLVN